MVLGIILKGIQVTSPHIAKALIRYSRAEGKVFNKLYGTTRGRGVRHGLAAGGVVGSLISTESPSDDNGSLSKEDGNASGKQNKTRSRFKRNTSSRRYNKQYPSKRCRCARNNKYRSSHYR